MYVFWENKGIMLQTLRGKQKYQITNVDVEKIKWSRLLVQRINEFKMNEIQPKSPQQPWPSWQTVIAFDEVERKPNFVAWLCRVGIPV